MPHVIPADYEKYSIYKTIESKVKGNDTVQIHFNYSYKLRIFFHTGRFAYRKMKDAKKIWVLPLS